MRYHNFDLWICRPAAKTRYPLRASTEALGEVPEDWMEIDLEEKDFADLSGRIQNGKEAKGDLLRFGSLLHEALFRSGNGQVERLFQRCLGMVQRKDDAIRIRLRIDDPQIAALPWEFLYASDRKQYLAASVDTVLVRYLEMPTPVRDLETGFPLCLLVVIPGGSGLDTDKEKAQLEKALAPLAKRVKPVWLEGCVTIGALDDALCDHPYHLVHFIGHGEFSESGASIFLNGDEDAPELVPVDEDRFAQLFANHRSIKLVVLNACEGATASQTKPLAGVAPQLVRQGVPAVVAMQFSIYDDVAIAFSHRFYAALLTGHQAGRIDVAMAQARNRLMLAFPELRDIGAPVLLLRAPEGVLFAVPAVGLGQRAREQLWVPRSKRQQEEARLRTLESNVRAFRKDGQEREAIEEHDELHRFRKELRYRRIANAAAACAALLIFVLGWLNAFDFVFGMQTRSETLVMWLGGLLRDEPLHPDIVMIAIDEGTAAQVGEPVDHYPAWRDTHGRLVDQLVDAGAKVIAFDFSFGPQADVADATNSFAASMRRATENGAAVVAGASEIESTTGAFKIDETLGEAASGVGDLWVEGVNRLSLGSLREGKLRRPALSLVAAAAYLGEDLENFNFHPEHLYRWGESSFHLGSRKICFTETRMPEDEVIQFLLSTPILTPGALRDPESCFRYEAVHGQMSDDDRKRHFRNKLVLVGDRLTKGEKKPVRGTLAWRYGMEIHAGAISDLLAGTSIRKPFYPGMLLISLLLATAGVCLGWRLASRPLKNRRWILFTACLIYLIVVITVYGWFHYLLDALTGIVVLWASYRVGLYIATLLNEPTPFSRSHGNESDSGT